MIHDWLSDPENVKAWGPILIGLVTVMMGLIALSVSSLLQLRVNLTAIRHFEKTHRESQNKIEREEILKKLREFYSPFKELRTESRVLYDFFALKEKKEAFEKRIDFRTVEVLVQGYQFDTRDAAILQEIIEIGARQIALIETNAAGIDSPALADLLGRLASHIRILALAHKGAVKGMTELNGIVFPREVDGAIESEIHRLRDKYESLKRDSDSMASSKSKTVDAKTVQYYNSNFEDYYKDTAWLDLKPLYSEFISQLPLGARILDAGCGVGRDTRYFITRGHKVVSFDPSRKMVELCRHYPFAYCQQKAFDEIEFVEEFDGVWACASLLHIRREDLPTILTRLATALRGDGVIYFSLKKGRGHTRTKGRYFAYYSLAEAENIVRETSNLVLLKSWENQSAMVGDNTTWLNLICRKPSMGRVQSSGLAASS